MSRRMAVITLAVLAAAVTAAINPRYLLVPLIPVLIVLPFMIAAAVLGAAGWCIYRIIRPGGRGRRAR